MAITLDAIQLGMDTVDDGGEEGAEDAELNGSSPASQQNTNPTSSSSTTSNRLNDDGPSHQIIRTPFGSFTVGNSIGRGAFAKVYKALWNETGFCVAVKTFDTSQMLKETVESVLIEVTLLGKLKHPNILRIIGYHKEAENLYLMLEFAENGSLLKLVKELNNLPEHLVCMYIEQVLKALAYLHGCGVIHRDLKAANILLTKSGDVKLADFGVAAVMGESDKHFTIVGSPYWMAPEIISATGHSTQSDIWSLGCTIIELLTGEPPYFGLNPMTAMFKIVQNPAPIPPDCSAPLKDLLERVFQKDPAKRPTAELLLRHSWFYHPYTASMEISAVREHVQAYQTEHNKNNNTNTSNNTGADKQRKSSSTSNMKVPQTRERRDSKVVIPEYQIERFENSSHNPSPLSSSPMPISAVAANALLDNDNTSSSESTRSLHDSSQSLEQLSASLRDSLSPHPIERQPKTMSQSQTTETQPKSQSVRMSGHERMQSCPPQNLQNILKSPLTAAPLPPRSSPLPPSIPAPPPPISSPNPNTHEEEMAKEIEDLKRRLMQMEMTQTTTTTTTTNAAGGILAPNTNAPLPPSAPISPAPIPPIVKSLKSQFIRDLQSKIEEVPPITTMRICCISAIGSSLWVGGADGTVTIFRISSSSSAKSSGSISLQPHTTFKLHKTRINSIVQVGQKRVWCSSEEGEIYIVPPKQPSEAKKIQVHDMEHRMIKCIGVVPGDKPHVWSCAPSLTNSQIVVLSKSGRIKYKLTIKQAINCVTLSPSLETVWLGCFGVIIVCDALRGDLRREIKLPDAAQCKKVTQLIPVGDLIWCSVGKQIIVLDPYTFKIERVLQQSSDVERLAVCEGVVFAGDTASQVQCYDPVSMSHIHMLSLNINDNDSDQPAPVKSLCVSTAPGRPPAIFAASPVSNKMCMWSAKQV